MNVMSRKIPVTFDRRGSRTVCFRGVSRRGIYGENGKNSSILISTILGFSFIMHCKLITQWVKYAFGCVFLDLSIAEMKKSSEILSSFIDITRPYGSSKLNLLVLKM